MSDRTIEPRDGIEVFVNKGGRISIKQEQLSAYHGELEDVIVVVHPDDAPRLIEFLEDARQEALEFEPESEPASDQPTGRASKFPFESKAPTKPVAPNPPVRRTSRPPERLSL
jgi:hypothetical protein